MVAGIARMRTATPARGGDRLYAVARALLLCVLFGGLTIIHALPLWPPTHHLVGNLFWAYAVFSLVAGGLTLLPAAQPVLPFSYAADLLWIAAISFWGPGSAHSYTLLFLLPLMAAALYLRRPATIALSVLAVALTVGVAFKPQQMLDGLSVASQLIAFSVLPCLFNLLSEQWTADNRQRVAEAERRATQSLTHAEAYRDRMRALYDVAVALYDLKQPAAVLHRTLSECARIVPYANAAIVLPTGTPGEVHVVASRNLGIAESQLHFAVGSGTLGAILRGSDGGVLHHAAADPEVNLLPSIAAQPTVLLLPLRSSRHTFGLVLFGSAAAEVTLEQMDMATALVSYGLVALQNATLISELESERDKLLAHEEEVRKQLNRDLHDGPAQALAAITMSIGFLKRLFQHDPQRVLAELDKLGATAQRANHEVRTLLFELRPLVLETQGLIPTLQQYLERFNGSAGPQISLEGNDTPMPLTKRVQGTLFNIVQESVNNALKHAQANHLWIRVATRGDELTLVIQDDGKGFDLQAVKASYAQRGSFGLLSLEERARLVGGSAEILSAIGAGTTVRVSVPLEI